MHVYDVVIIGSGMGGAAFLSQIVQTGLRILVLERGAKLAAEKENWSAEEIFVNKRYACEDRFIDRSGQEFVPRMYYVLGGNSKVFGASAYRFRSIDFEETVYDHGTSPAWPFSYDELAPYYDMAERAMSVCGKSGVDPSEAARAEYPNSSYPHEPYIAELAEQLSKRGLHPFPLPLAIDTTRCRKGSPCDGFPCRIKAKHDAEVSFMLPVLKQWDNVELWMNAYVERLESDDKRVLRAYVNCGDVQHVIESQHFVLAAGAINSALLLLRSKNNYFPQGLANSSDLVGRNYMSHINSVLLAIHPFKKNPTRFQKTLAVNDYYLMHSKQGCRLGSIQMRGKIQEENLRKHKNVVIRYLRNFVAAHSADFWIMTEDLPNPSNRVYYDEQQRVHLDQTHSNIATHRELLQRFSAVLKKVGYAWVHADLRLAGSVQHQCGTIRCGKSPQDSVLDKNCRAHDLQNLHVVDASIFPSSAAVNPALTIAANAMRVGAVLSAILCGKAVKSEKQTNTAAVEMHEQLQPEHLKEDCV